MMTIPQALKYVRERIADLLYQLSQPETDDLHRKLIEVQLREYFRWECWLSRDV